MANKSEESKRSWNKFSGGIMEMLSNRDNEPVEVKSYYEGPLNLDSAIDMLYAIKKSREKTGVQHPFRKIIGDGTMYGVRILDANDRLFLDCTEEVYQKIIKIVEKENNETRDQE